jgi:hypothetical protein
VPQPNLQSMGGGWVSCLDPICTLHTAVGWVAAGFAGTQRVPQDVGGSWVSCLNPTYRVRLDFGNRDIWCILYWRQAAVGRAVYGG